MEKAGPAGVHNPEQRVSPGKARDACRLRPLKVADQADELVPALQLRHRDHVRVSRPCRKNAADAELKGASARQSPVAQANQQG